MKDEKKTTVGRRDFLRKVGLGAVGAGASVPTPLTGPAHADTDKNEEKRTARHKETEHINTVYLANRYPD